MYNMVPKFTVISIFFNIVIAVYLSFYEVNAQTTDCPSGWVVFRSSCYKFVKDAKDTWRESEYICSLMGAKLVEIETKEENNFIESQAYFLSSRSDISYWLGGADITSEGEFRWVKSQEKFNFTDWQPGNPSDSWHNEDCVHLLFDRQTSLLAWNDVACENRYNFICEKTMSENQEVIIG